MMNQINLMGRLVKDPEASESSGGTPKAAFCIACERDFKAKNEEKPKADFINCVAWGTTAQFVEKYFKKGQLCGISGRLEINSYLNEAGERRSFTQVKVDRVYFASAKASTGAAAEEAPEAPYDNAFVELMDDDSDLPF